jgi:hypothetical protein
MSTFASRPILPLLFFAVVCGSLTFGAAAAVAQEKDSPALGRIKQANSVVIDCSACPRALAKADAAAKQELGTWNRFRIVDDPKQADLVLMFSGNPYMGDYLTRKKPDDRPVKINSTIMTVIDPRTGEELWSDSRTWGSWRVSSATKSLIDELRGELEVETRKWSLDDVLRCSGASAYQSLAFLTPDAALDRNGSGVRRNDDDFNRLDVSSPGAPDFCRRAQLVVAANNKISGFEVVASPSDALDVADILEQADRFLFTSGKDPRTQQAYFIAQTRDKKVLIQFAVQGRRTVLSRVIYSY